MSRLQHKKGRKSNYVLSFQNSEYWKEVRTLILARDRSCVHCGSKLFLEVHHITYEHKGFEKEHLGDLILLCSECHKKIHGK